MNKKVDITPLKTIPMRGVYTTLVKSKLAPELVAITIQKLGQLTQYPLEQLIEMVTACREQEAAIPSAAQISRTMVEMGTLMDEGIKATASRLEYLKYWRRDNPQLIAETQAQLTDLDGQLSEFQAVYYDMHQDISFVPELLVDGIVKPQLGKDIKK